MKKERNIEDILELEGVNCDGYGIISQAVMFDIDLPIQSKAIYAYFCSFLGSGRTIFPKRDTILSDLKISKNAYYKYFTPLLENGYIEISKAKGYKNKNIYKICNKPNKVNCTPFSKNNGSESLLAIDGINANGFGFIPKLIMCDSRLSIKSKALVAFFYSLVQSGFRVYPHRSTVCSFLDISKNVYYNALNQLIEYGYLTVRQRHTSKGQFTVNDYILNSNPKAKEKNNENSLPCLKNEDIIKNSLNTETAPCPKNEDIIKNGLNTEVLPCLNNKDIINLDRVRKNETLPCLENCDNNNITSNNNKIYLPSSNLNCNIIPYTSDRKKIQDMIYDLTRYEDYSCLNGTEENITFCRRYKKTVNALIEMLCVEDHYIYAMQCVKTKDLFEALNCCITKDFDGYSLRDLIFEIVCHYDYASSTYQITKPFEYLKSLIWHNIKNYCL